MSEMELIFMTNPEFFQLCLDVIGSAFLAGLFTGFVWTAFGKNAKLF